MLFGTALAIGTTFTVLPMEALAEGTCQWGGSSCDGNTHDHEVTVESGQEITEGTFIWTVTVNNGGKISGGTFNANIIVNSGGEISNFTDRDAANLIKVNSGGKITGGTFCRPVELAGGTITGGTFKNANTRVNSGTIKGGTFEDFLYNNGTIEGGTFNCTFTNQYDGSITGGTFEESVTNYGSITGGTFKRGIDNKTGGSVHLPSSTPEPSSTPAASESTGTSAPVHEHSYAWVTVKEAGIGEDGLEEYRCSCGDVAERTVIPASEFYVKQLYGDIRFADANGKVVFDAGSFHTISDYLLTILQSRQDVTLCIRFSYKGTAYEAVFVPDTDYTELLNDSEQFYGLLRLNGWYGVSVLPIGNGAL